MSICTVSLCWCEDPGGLLSIVDVAEALEEVQVTSVRLPCPTIKEESLK